ncbi:MAG: hypothetical protein OXC60_16685 [Litoreibacter sp.]|nr:hypothetical protein [Litoreibacter sp.]MCY4336293.1 hypothetical protein [Litoreibacter sp.]
MRILITLYVLLTSYVPFPMRLVLRGATIICAYFAALPYTTMLSAIGSSPMNFAITAGLVSFFLTGAGATYRRYAQSDAKTVTLLTVATAIGVSSSVSLTLPFDLLALCVIPFAYAIYALGFWAMLCIDPESLTRMTWDARTWDEPGQRNAAHWHVLRGLAASVAATWLAFNTNGLSWIIGYAALPFALHYIYWWTVYATHPIEDAPPDP